MLLTWNNPVAAQWVQQGPGPSKNGQVEGVTDREITGAIQCVTPHPVNADILYIGAVNGGIWRTSNATAAKPAWEFISADLTGQSIGGLEFDPTDATHLTLVAGIGRTSSFGVSIGTFGIFRTTNGTAPWTNIDAGGTFNNRNITGIAPRGAIIVVSTRDGGIFRTTNTGGLWTQISGGAGTGLPAGNSFDLISDPATPSTLYTNAGTGGIYKSMDNGATWTKVSDAAVDADLAGAGNIRLAAGNSNNLFLAIVRGGRLGDVYRSGDGGTSWTALDIPNTVEAGTNFGIHVGGQGNTHTSLAADPANSNVVYIGGDRQPWATEPTPPVNFPNSLGANNFTGRLFRIDASLAAGSQVTAITHVGTAGNSAPHADSRDMDFDASGDLLEVDDGGVYKQTSPADATGNWFSLNGNINVTEVHSADWDKNSNIIIVGAQDNAVTEQEFPTNNRWKNVSNGDGGDVLADDFTSAATSARYSSTQRLGGFVRRVYSSGNVFQSQIQPALINTATAARVTGASFVTPVKINTQDGTRLLVATNSGLFESSDQGATLTSISGISVNANGRDALIYGAAANSNIIYAGSGNGVFIRDAAAPDPLTQSAAYTGGNVEGITIDPDDPQSAYVIDPNAVFETTNTGTSWTNITGNLGTLNPGQLRSITYIPTSTNDMLAVGADQGVFVAPGPAFNTWARLGTNLPLAAVFDLDYDPADGMLLAGTLGRGAWTFNLTERDPVDVALVLDFSGSMLSNACGTCSPKIDVLKDATEIFMQLWKALAVTNDRIGAVYFRTNVNEFQDAGNVLLPVIDKTDNIIADMRSQTTTPAQLTAMGGGLQDAINRLTDATRPRNIILFTDGMQNVNPGVVFPSLNIENGVFGTNSNIVATSPATTLNPALGIKVNTIGVGATSSFVTQLADIASGTNGLTKITTAPDEDLRRFFVEELVDVLRSFSPQLVAYRKGSINEATRENFTVNRTAKAVVFKISYSRGDKMKIVIRKGKTDVTPFANIINGPFYQIFSFPFEKLLVVNSQEPGTEWTVSISGKKDTPYEIALIADDASLKYYFPAIKKIYRSGEPLQLEARVLINKKPIEKNIRVTAVIQRPAVSINDILSKTADPGNKDSLRPEPGMLMGEKKYAALLQNPEFVKSLKPLTSEISLDPDGQNVFKAAFSETKIPGTYTITYLIKGDNAATGPFERSEQQSFVVRFGEIDLDKSAISVKRTILRSRQIQWVWTFTPVDKYGNYLGPDNGHLFTVTSKDGRVTNKKDPGNGSYSFELTTSTKDIPHLSIRYSGESWFDNIMPFK